jgi:drug/metabolite transporter (DMT)-like permease
VSGRLEAEAVRALVPYLVLVVPPLCWAGNFIVGRAVHADIPPMALTFWRWVVAAAVLAPFSAVDLWRRRAIVRAHLGRLALLAVTGVAVFQFAVYQGLRTTTAISGTLIIATIPVVIPVFAFLLDGSRIGVPQAAGIAVSLAGVAIIILKGDIGAIARFAWLPGDLWMLVAVVAWSLYSVVIRKRPADLPSLTLLFAIVILGLVLLTPAYAWEAAVKGGFRPTPPALLAIGYVGVFASVIAFICWNEGVARVGAARAGLFIHLMPVFAAGLAMVFLGERLYGYHAVGVALVAAGLALSSFARTPSPPEASRGRSD